jgi:hypothetical protein
MPMDRRSASRVGGGTAPGNQSILSYRIAVGKALRIAGPSRAGSLQRELRELPGHDRWSGQVVELAVLDPRQESGDLGTRVDQGGAGRVAGVPDRDLAVRQGRYLDT